MNWIRQWGRRPDRPLKTQMSSAGELRTYGNPLVDTRGERGRQDEERVGCGVCWSSRQVLSEQEGCSQDCHGSKNYCSLLKTAGCPLSNCPKPWSCSWVIGRWSGRWTGSLGQSVVMLYRTIVLKKEPSRLVDRFTYLSTIYWCSDPHMWSWALGSDRKDKVTDTSGWNEVSLASGRA